MAILQSALTLTVLVLSAVSSLQAQGPKLELTEEQLRAEQEAISSAQSEMLNRASDPNNAIRFPFWNNQSRYVIGVAVEPLQPGVHQLLSIEENTGLLVMRVAPNKPAAEAGMHQYDLILSVNGAPLSTPEDLVSKINEAQGEPLTFQIRRAQEQLEIEIVPIQTPSGPLAADPENAYTAGKAFSVPQGQFPVPLEMAGPMEFNMVGPGVIESHNVPSKKFEELRKDVDRLCEQQKEILHQLQQLLEQTQKN